MIEALRNLFSKHRTVVVDLYFPKRWLKRNAKGQSQSKKERDNDICHRECTARKMCKEFQERLRNELGVRLEFKTHPFSE